MMQRICINALRSHGMIKKSFRVNEYTQIQPLSFVCWKVKLFSLITNEQHKILIKKDCNYCLFFK